MEGTSYVCGRGGEEDRKGPPLFVGGVERRIGKGLLCLWEGWRGGLEGASFVCGRGGEEDRKGPPLFVVGVERRIGRGLLCLW